ncbi:hypothetical protein [Rubinisphaera brasiliensis]|uniref:Uncharacterized protein n=1 Tax=Rubinisphaera brasiliensis (strain ATCC 49424 / DSM 5305 / JCM 21570 / IAM 15109 / NBRC 103401 / IFAM 1448) TaxID=756272 RepID=F0SH14_RUBBR|nr:hypothetical protein [Rubinisphaera brasiliensis]ADY59499.1 hypothetical protein Plabr_1890 [Rubinisphaera brasiliensis DSM 5305]
MNRLVLGLMFVCVAACLAAAVGYAEDSSSSLKVGDRIELQLTGRPATDFIRLVGRPLPIKTFGYAKQTGLALNSRVISIDDDNVTAEYYHNPASKNEEPMILTITLVRPLEDVQYQATTPSSGRVGLREKQNNSKQPPFPALPFLRHDSYDGLKVRAWTVAREIPK